MHDPKVYPDPDEFRPERFIRDGKIDPEVRDPSAFVFGSGRRYAVPALRSRVSHHSTYHSFHVRICPGRYFADTGLFINIASFLHVFDIGQPFDNAGNPIRIPHSMTDGFLSSVLRFRGGPLRTRVLIWTLGTSKTVGAPSNHAVTGRSHSYWSHRMWI